MLPILVISLPGATERRERAAKQMREQGVSFEFHDACDGSRGEQVFNRCDDEQFILHTGRAITPGEIGCFASHKELWQKCARENRPIMIMEDDFCLEPDFANAVRAATVLINDLKFIRLQDERRGKSTPVMPFGEFQVERYTKTPHCAMCYAISPDIARRWLKLYRDFEAPVDVVLKHVWTFENPMYCLTPYTVTSGALSYESMIGERAKCSKCFRTRLRRTWLKIGWQWHRLLFNLRQSDAAIRRRYSELDVAMRARDDNPTEASG